MRKSREAWRKFHEISDEERGQIKHVESNCGCSGKRCTDCAKAKCISQFSKSRKRGINSYCLQCSRIRCANYREKNREQERERVRQYHATHKEQGKERWKQYSARVDRREYHKNYRSANIEKIKERDKAYGRSPKKVAYRKQRYLRNRATQIAAVIEWRKKNPGRHAANGKRYRAKNAEKVRMKDRERNSSAARQAYRKERYLKFRAMRIAGVIAWYKKNPERHLANQAKRRARKARAGGSFTAQEWQSLKAQYNFTCLCCKRKEPDIKLTADHVVPIVKGGNSSIENIQPLCKPCNSSKGTKIIDYRPLWQAS